VFSFYLKKTKAPQFLFEAIFFFVLIFGTQVMVLLAWGSEWLKMNSDVFKRFMFKLLGAVSRDGGLLASEWGPFLFFCFLIIFKRNACACVR
jgi:hypothetical protein